MRVRPYAGWEAYTEIMDSLDDPRSKAMLDNMRYHGKYECLQDPTIFETLVPVPEYRFYSCFDNAVLTNMEQVQKFYYDLWDSNSSLFEVRIDHCATADWGVACDGEWYQQVPGKALIDAGNNDVEADAFYLSHAHLSWFFPFHEVDGKLLLGGEICYVDEANATLDKLDPADVLTLEEAKASWHD
jgi:hypothetical protein